jgi:hypothetical protein
MTVSAPKYHFYSKRTFVFFSMIIFVLKIFSKRVFVHSIDMRLVPQTHQTQYAAVSHLFS